MPKLTINTREGYSECECCGCYDWEEASVKIDGREILDHMGDTHLGGGTWHSWEYAVKDIFQAMGYEVEINRNEC